MQSQITPSQTMQQQEDEHWMRHAMALATQAERAGEVPVGAVLVRAGQMVAEGWNLSLCEHDPTAHAEIRVLRQAGQQLSNYRLLDTTLYVTLEPCPMCCGAILLSRIKKVYYGASDLKGGTAGTLMNLLQDERFNHQSEVERGVLEEECRIPRRISIPEACRRNYPWVKPTSRKPSRG